MIYASAEALFRLNLSLIVVDESHTATVYASFYEKEQRCHVSHFSSTLRGLADRFSASFNPRSCSVKSASLLFVVKAQRSRKVLKYL